MVASISAQVALFAFSVATLGGLLAGNSPQTVLSRALIAMVVALFVAQFSAWCGKLVLREHIQSRKSAADPAHATAEPPAQAQRAGADRPG